MRAFVTGGSGFLGGRIVARLLQDGVEVLALARESSDTSKLEEGGVRIVTGDLCDVDAFADSLDGCDVVYHAGARVVTHGGWSAFYDANVLGTERLLDAAIARGVGRFVHVSSIGIFEIDRDGTVITEETDYDHHPELRGDYTRSKIQADRVACAAARTGKPVVVVRPGQLYGGGHPNEPYFLGRVNKFVRPGLLAVVSTPSYSPPLIHVDNAADAIVLAGSTPGVEGAVFNVIDDSQLTQSSYFRALADARGDGLKVVYLPVAIFAPAVKVADTLHRILRRRSWNVAYQLLRSGRNARYSTAAAQARLGWKPRIDLHQGLADAVAGRA